jgi:hypothetical protein
VFFKQKTVLGYIPVIKVGNTHIEQNIQQKGEIEKGEIHSVSVVTHKVLHIKVDSKNPERFDQQVQGKQ